MFEEGFFSFLCLKVIGFFFFQNGSVEQEENSLLLFSTIRWGSFQSFFSNASIGPTMVSIPYHFLEASFTA